MHVEILDEEIKNICDNEYAHITIRTDGETPAHFSNGLLEFSHFQDIEPMELETELGDFIMNDGPVISPRALMYIPRRKKRRQKR